MIDVKELKQQFKEVIKYSQGIENPKIDVLFTSWYNNKRDFIEAMGGKLIYEYPKKLTFHLDEKSRSNRIQEFCECVEECWRNPELAAFIQNSKEDFFTNILSKDYDFFNTKIKKGSKIIKAFKFFESDKYILKDIQNAASRIIQEDCVSGTLCISVHPLDYLSCSENTHNWRSCHALDGEFRSGSLSYMADPSTVICYLKSDEDVKLPNFPFKWNSKKWRVLLHFSNDWNMIFAGRQYPFTSVSGLDVVKDELLSASNLITSNCSYTPWCNSRINNFTLPHGSIYTEDNYYIVGKQFVKEKDLIHNCCTTSNPIFFNDLLYSTVYTPQYCYRVYGKYEKPWDSPTGLTNDETEFFIGSDVVCPCCGEDLIEISESMLCSNCEIEYGHLDDDEFGFCDCCGRHFYLDDGLWLASESAQICPECARTEVFSCQSCGQMHYTANMVYDRKNAIYCCEECSEVC